jgi:cytochrome c553
MPNRLTMLAVGCAALAVAAIAFAAGDPQPSASWPSARGPMAWAYPSAPTEQAAAGFFRSRKVYRAPGSRFTLNEAQLDDPWDAVDWFPAEHPPAPAIVLHGRKPAVGACALCHMTNGEGGLGVPALAGLPRDYIAAQANAFANGQRRSTWFVRDIGNMVDTARAAHGDEIAAAATYYSRLPYRPWIRVTETRTTLPTAPSYWGWTEVRPGAAREPLGVRIVEAAEDRQRAGMADPHSGFVAFIPVGSLARGRALTHRGAGGQAPCASCHGADLRGAPGAPPLAGRSPTYLARQLWDFRSGARHDPGAAAMKPVASALGPASIVDIAAYAASLRP